MGIKKCTNDLLEKLVKPFKKCSYCLEVPKLIVKRFQK